MAYKFGDYTLQRDADGYYRISVCGENLLFKTFVCYNPAENYYRIDDKRDLSRETIATFETPAQAVKVAKNVLAVEESRRRNLSRVAVGIDEICGNIRLTENEILDASGTQVGKTRNE